MGQGPRGFSFRAVHGAGMGLCLFGAVLWGSNKGVPYLWGVHGVGMARPLFGGGYGARTGEFHLGASMGQEQGSPLFRGFYGGGTEGPLFRGILWGRDRGFLYLGGSHLCDFIGQGKGGVPYLGGSMAQGPLFRALYGAGPGGSLANVPTPAGGDSPVHVASISGHGAEALSRPSRGAVGPLWGRRGLAAVPEHGSTLSSPR